MKCSYYVSLLSVTFIVKLCKCEEYETPTKVSNPWNPQVSITRLPHVGQQSLYHSYSDLRSLPRCVNTKEDEKTAHAANFFFNVSGILCTYKWFTTAYNSATHKNKISIYNAIKISVLK
jgi:hypothetical protein